MDTWEAFTRQKFSSVDLDPRPDEPQTATLLRDARWHAGLTQAEVAQRAQTSQQAVARYEKGVHVPSLVLLRRMLAACGMHLELTLTPQPGLIDAPTRDLLDKPPLDRLPPQHLKVLTTLGPVLLGLGLPVLVSDRCAARLRGALVKVFEVEFWVDEAVDIAPLQRALEEAGATLWGPDEKPTGPGLRSRLDVLDGGVHGCDFRIRGMDQFAHRLGRATELGTPFGQVFVTARSDTALFWRARDPNHLALQRAAVLRSEREGPDGL